MSLIQKIFKNFKASEISYVEVKLAKILDKNKALYHELDSIIFMYESLLNLSSSPRLNYENSPSLLPKLSAITKEKVLICLEILNYCGELENYDLQDQIDVNLVKFCKKVALQEKENRKHELGNRLSTPEIIGSGNFRQMRSSNFASSNGLSQNFKPKPNLKDEIIHKIQHTTPNMRQNVDQFSGKIDELSEGVIEEINQMVEVENKLLKDQIRLIQTEIDKKIRSKSENDENKYSIDFLRFGRKIGKFFFLFGGRFFVFPGKWYSVLPHIFTRNICGIDTNS